jgi:D-alanine-D-alanine ligase
MGASTEADPRVVVLAGGLSHERDVSLRSGARVVEALQAAGLEAHVRDVDAGLIAALVADRPTTAFPLLHGTSGEDGAIASVLELLGVPFVGSGAAACRQAFDKAVAKTVVAAAGVATPVAVALSHSTFRDLGAGALLDAVADRIGLPLVVKPNAGGSALGVTVVRRRDELPGAMVAAYAYGDVALLERCVVGTEVAVTVLDDPAAAGGLRALPAVEIVPDGGFYDYAARYTAGRTEFFAPARLDAQVAAAAADAALAAHRALGLRHLSRTDLVVDAAGQPWFLEVNVSPGMTETSLAPQAVRAAGLDLGEICRTLVLSATATAGAGGPGAPGRPVTVAS